MAQNDSLLFIISKYPDEGKDLLVLCFLSSGYALPLMRVNEFVGEPDEGDTGNRKVSDTLAAALSINLSTNDDSVDGLFNSNSVRMTCLNASLGTSPRKHPTHILFSSPSGDSITGQQLSQNTPAHDRQ